LLSKGSGVEDWRALRRTCLLTQANVALASGRNADALSYAKNALQGAQSAETGKAFDDGYGLAAYAVPKGYRLVGDAESALGNTEAARAAWNRALAAIPETNAERPFEMSEHQIILRRLGRIADAQRLASRLSAMGYREPELSNG
jgi:tetratricopeptide (TPR) repeat protein